MAKRIKGITIELDGETKGLDNALKDVNKRSRDTQKELRDVDKLLRFNPENTELLAQKQKLLGEQVENTGEKLKGLKDAEAEVQRQFEAGEINEQQYRDFQREIVETESKLEHFESQLETTQTRWEKFSEGAKKSGEAMKNAGDKIGGTGKALTKGVTAPIAGAAGALGIFIKKTADTADEVAKNSRKVGVGVEEYQEYSYALGQAGLSQENTDKTLGRLNQRIGEAREGNEKYSDALKAAGVNMEDLESGALSTDEVMMQAVEGLSQITNEQDRAAAASELFGTKLGRELMPALEDGAEGLEEGRQKAQELGNVFSEETAIKAEEFNDSLEDLQEGIKGAFMELAEQLLPVLTDELLPALEEHVIPAIETLADWIKSLIEWFFELSPTTQKIIVSVVAFAAALGPLLVVVGAVVGAIGSIISILPVLGGALGVLTGPIGITIAIITGLIAIGIALWKNWDTIKDKAVSIWGSITDFFGRALEGLKLLFNLVLNFLDDKTNGAFSNIFKVVKKYMTLVKDNATAVLNFLKNTFKNALAMIKALFTGDFKGMKEIAERQMQNVRNLIKNIWGNIMKFFRGINLRQVGIDIIRGLIGGIKNMAKSAVNAVKNVVGGAISGAKSLLGISSPSKVFEEIGENTGEGMERGLRSMGGRVDKASEEMTGQSLPEKTSQVGRSTDRLLEATMQQNEILMQLLTKDTDITLDGESIEKSVTKRQRRKENKNKRNPQFA